MRVNLLLFLLSASVVQGSHNFQCPSTSGRRLDAETGLYDGIADYTDAGIEVCYIAVDDSGVAHQNNTRSIFSIVAVQNSTIFQGDSGLFIS